MNAAAATATLVLFTILKGCGGRELSDEEQLIDDMFKKYKPTARPVMRSHDSVKVNLQFSLMHIKELESIQVECQKTKDSYSSQDAKKSDKGVAVFPVSGRTRILCLLLFVWLMLQ